MRGLPSFFIAVTLGCNATTRPRSPSESRPAEAHSAPVAVSPQRAPAPLRQVFTGQAQPSLSVKNAFPIAQHVFIDWQPRGVLAPAASQSFELSVGTHTITCADSQDPDDHPAAVTESFATGYAYSYEIHP